MLKNSTCKWDKGVGEAALSVFSSTVKGSARFSESSRSPLMSPFEKGYFLLLSDEDSTRTGVELVMDGETTNKRTEGEIRYL